MTLTELFQQSWLIGAAVVLGIAVIALLFISIIYQLIVGNRDGAETVLVKLLDKGTVWLAGFMQDHFLWLSDEEPECPAWADPERWRDSLR